MERPCHRCGGEVADGTPFCPNCGAPQIRVAPRSDAGLAPSPSPVDLGVLGGSGEASYAVSGVGTGVAPPSQMLRGHIQWSQARAPIGKSAAIVAALMLVPWFGGLFFLWLPLGGALAVWFYRRAAPRLLISAGMGARLGAVTGFFAFALWLLTSAAALLALRFGFHQNIAEKFRLIILAALGDAAARNPTPEAQQVLKIFSTAEGMAVFITLMLVLTLLGFIIFFALGGATGAAAFGKKETAAPPPRAE